MTSEYSKPLNNWTHWGMDRGGDNLMMVYWLYNITGKKFLLNLAELIHKQTVNLTDVFLNGDLSRPWSFHCVNVAQAMKEPIVFYQQDRHPRYVNAVKKGLADLRRYHGVPTGLYGADEMLHGSNPTQGSEFCTAVEMMYSMETILPITGEVQFADQLEKVAFNALPTQATDNYDSRQYFQQANQVLITKHPRNFNTAYEGTGLLFGPLTGYPCVLPICTRVGQSLHKTYGMPPLIKGSQPWFMHLHLYLLRLETVLPFSLPKILITLSEKQ